MREIFNAIAVFLADSGGGVLLSGRRGSIGEGGAVEVAKDISLAWLNLPRCLDSFRDSSLERLDIISLRAQLSGKVLEAKSI